MVPIREYEQIDIYNVTNGERFTTYAIRGERGSGIVSVNGAAARKAAPGDLLIVVSYGVLTEDEVRYFQPRLVYVDARNRILSERAAIPVQLAA
jgi:aspartate 1-decarboxylase